MKPILIIIMFFLMSVNQASAYENKTVQVHEAKRVEELVYDLRNMGYPQEILNKTDLQQKDVEWIYDANTSLMRYDGKFHYSKRDNKYHIEIAIRNKNWNKTLLHEFGHALASAQKWRIKYFFENLTIEKLEKLSNAREEEKELINKGIPKVIQQETHWKNDIREIYAESFVAKYYPGYTDGTTIFVSPENPAVDINATEQEARELYEQLTN